MLETLDQPLLKVKLGEIESLEEKTGSGGGHWRVVKGYLYSKKGTGEE